MTLEYWCQMCHSISPRKNCSWIVLVQYLQGKIDLGLFYLDQFRPKLICIYNPCKVHSQKAYLFTSGNIALPWHHTKQSIIGKILNHNEIITFQAASRECVWLRLMAHYI